MMNAVHIGQNPLDSGQLNAFASLARTGSFTETVRELFLTQSAISNSNESWRMKFAVDYWTAWAKRARVTPEPGH
jgi:DNA-binding transcriptional LysR family regulator